MHTPKLPDLDYMAPDSVAHRLDIRHDEALALLRAVRVHDKLLEVLEAASPKLRHETDACAVARVGTCVRCTVETAIAEAKGEQP